MNHLFFLDFCAGSKRASCASEQSASGGAEEALFYFFLPRQNSDEAFLLWVVCTCSHIIIASLPLLCIFVCVFLFFPTTLPKPLTTKAIEDHNKINEKSKFTAHWQVSRPNLFSMLNVNTTVNELKFFRA